MGAAVTFLVLDAAANYEPAQRSLRAPSSHQFRVRTPSAQVVCYVRKDFRNYTCPTGIDLDVMTQDSNTIALQGDIGTQSCWILRGADGGAGDQTRGPQRQYREKAQHRLVCEYAK